MRRALVALLFVVACKDKKPDESAASATPTPTEKPSPSRPRPSLGTPGGEAPRMGEGPVPHLEGSAADDEDWRERREERRKAREEKLDTNHDGVVSDDERMQRMAPMRDRLDTNHDGKLTPEELQASERRMFTDAASIDTNKDGDISLAELDHAFQARRDEMRDRWRQRAQGGADGDGAHVAKPAGQ